MRYRLALALVLLVLLSACTADVRIDPGRARTTAQPIASPSVPSRELLGPGVRWRARATPIGYGNGLVVVGDETGVSAYGLRCRRPCEPAFTARLDTPGSALVHRHIAYVGTDHGVAILSLRCSGSCHPVGWLRSGGVAEPAFDGYANPPNSYIPVGVAGGHVLVQVGWNGFAGSGVYGSRLEAFPFGCRHSCAADWRSPIGAGRYPPAVARSLVLAPRIGRLEAFPAGCATPRCAPAWRGVLYRRPSITWTETPVVAGGLAIASTRGCVCGAEGNVPRVEAFPLSCGTDGTTCEPAWSTTFPGTRFNSGLVVHDGLAYLVVDGLDKGVRGPRVPGRLRRPLQADGTAGPRPGGDGVRARVRRRLCVRPHSVAKPAARVRGCVHRLVQIHRRRTAAARRSRAVRRARSGPCRRRA
jgi:hypothetical protein